MIKGKSLVIAVQPAQKSNQSKFEQGEGAGGKKQKRPVIERMKGMSHTKKKKNGNYIPFQIEVCVKVLE